MIKSVRPKKNLGQHFLTDLGIAKAIADTVDACPDIPVLEIGPGMGVMTQFLVTKPRPVKAVEIDKESVAYLNEKFPKLRENIIGQDFLRMDLNDIFDGNQFVLTGNYPYDISSQIFFKMLDYKHLIPCCTGMIQREVALRIASEPGNKAYGILSVLIQAWYDVEYLFTVDDGVQSASKGEECRHTHDPQRGDRPRMRRASLQARGEDRLQSAPQDAARVAPSDLRRFGIARVLRSGHHDKAPRTAVRTAVRGADQHGGRGSREDRKDFVNDGKVQ